MTWLRLVNGYPGSPTLSVLQWKMDDSLSAISLLLGATLTLLPFLPAVIVAVMPSGNMIWSMRRSPSMTLVVNATERLLSSQVSTATVYPVKRSCRQHGLVPGSSGWPDAGQGRAHRPQLGNLLAHLLEGERRFELEAFCDAVTTSSNPATAFVAVFLLCWPRPLLLASSSTEQAERVFIPDARALGMRKSPKIEAP